MRRTLPTIVLVALVCVSCASPPPSEPPTTGPECFGIDCGFSGRLTRREEAFVPEALRGAFYIESVKDVSLPALKEMTLAKEVVAQETRAGVRYVALRDYRCVEFEGGISGMMIVIERYRVREE